MMGILNKIYSAILGFFAKKEIATEEQVDYKTTEDHIAACNHEENIMINESTKEPLVIKYTSKCSSGDFLADMHNSRNIMFE